MTLATLFLVSLAACSQGPAVKQTDPQDLAENPIICGLQFSPDGKWLAAATNLPNRGGPIMIWNTTDWRTEVSHFELTGGRDVSFSPDSTRLAYTTRDGYVGVIDIESRKQSGKFQVSLGEVYSVTFTPNGTQVATSGADGKIRFWDVRTGARLQTLDDQQEEIMDIAISPDGKLLLAASMKLVTLRDMATGELKFQTTGERGARRVRFTADGRFFYFSSWSGGTRVFETNSKELWLKPLGGRSDAAITSDCRWLATSGWDNTAHVFKLHLERQTVAQADQTRQLISRFASDDYGVREAASAEIVKIEGFSEVLRGAMSSPNAEVRIRARSLFQQKVSPTPFLELSGHAGDVEVVCFSPNDKLLVTGSRGGDVRVWSVPGFQHMKTLHSQSKE